MMLTEQGVQ